MRKFNDEYIDYYLLEKASSGLYGRPFLPMNYEMWVRIHHPERTLLTMTVA